MDGFIAQQTQGARLRALFNPAAGDVREPDVMGYHDRADIPNYWAYATNLCSGTTCSSPTLPGAFPRTCTWSRSGRRAARAATMSCVNDDQNRRSPPDYGSGVAAPRTPDYEWTDLTYLLHKYGVSWAYYVFKGSEPDCDDDAAMSCAPVKQGAKTPGIWNPLPYFDTVQQDDQLGNVQSLSNFFIDAKLGSLPAVSWITPNGTVSEHPPALVSTGQSYVTGLINAIMKAPIGGARRSFSAGTIGAASTTT